MGESIAEGTIVKWLKKPGDTVEKDEPLFEISTDKVDAEIPSPSAGTLQEILVPEGNTVEVNTVVARIAAAGAAKPAAETKPAPSAEKPAAETKPSPAPPPSGPEPAKPSVPSPTAPKAPPPPAPKSPPPPSPTPGVRADREPAVTQATGVATLEERVRTKSSPLVRKMAAEHDADITQMHGTGIHGRVTKQDFERHLETIEAATSAVPAPVAEPAPVARPTPPRAAPAAAPAAARTFAPAPGDRVEPMTIMRLKIAEHMIESRRTSAHVQTFWEMDVAHLERLRKEHGEQFLQRNGVKLTYTAFIAKATCDALKAVPVMNASLSGTEIVYHGAIHLGIAVALDWGLIVPVIKHAGDMNISGLARSITDLAGRARSKRLSPDEVTGGTFTITNPGVYGGLFGCPIINQPQLGILGVGAVEKRPVVIEDAIAIRPMSYLSLSFDHRVIDGATAERYMGELKKSLLAINESAL
jgi:2-oxoglutarate dehydrogenase E2 component (dihydrolipoamide succinyltransferase)